MRRPSNLTVSLDGFFLAGFMRGRNSSNSNSEQTLYSEISVGVGPLINRWTTEGRTIDEAEHIRRDAEQEGDGRTRTDLNGRLIARWRSRPHGGRR